MQQRVVLIHSGQRIGLGDGVTVIGRGLQCQIRFNDPAVSREHLRIVVSGERAVLVNLSTSNGTLVNKRPLARPHELRQGDEIQLGYRRILVEVAVDVGSGAVEVPSDAPVDQDQLAEESTRPGDEGWRQRASSAARPAPRRSPAAPAMTASRLAEIERHTCPRCRTVISFGSDNCDRCGYTWPAGHPSSVTQEIVIDRVTKRKDPRYSVEVPVIYVSAALTVEAVVRDLSRGGMFIATDLLDPVGTPCELTVLPDGYAAMTFSGMVAHVAADASRGRGETGLGIRFVSGTDDGLEWLERTISRYGAAIVT